MDIDLITFGVLAASFIAGIVFAAIACPNG
jgi:hypothetical protein